MSGDGYGLFVVPAAAVATVGVAGMAAYGIGKGVVAGGKALASYEAERRRQKQLIKESGVKDSIGDFRKTMNQQMEEQKQENADYARQLKAMRETAGREMMDSLSKMSAVEYETFLKKANQSQLEMCRQVEALQVDFHNRCVKKMQADMREISREVNTAFEKYEADLAGLSADKAKKEQRAAELCRSYLEEAKTVYESLVCRCGEDARSDVLKEQIQNAAKLYNAGSFEAGMAAAKDAVLAGIEEVYNADIRQTDWENSQEAALAAAAELGESVKQRMVITEEMRQSLNDHYEIHISEDAVGMNLMDYAVVNAEGVNELAELGKKLEDLTNRINQGGMTTLEMRQAEKDIRGILGVSFDRAIRRTVCQMAAEEYLEEKTDDVIDHFEERGFTYEGCAQDDDGKWYLKFNDGADTMMLDFSAELMGNGEMKVNSGTHFLTEGVSQDRIDHYEKVLSQIMARDGQGMHTCDKQTRFEPSKNEKVREMANICE